jgi:hypothetical protein
MPRGRPKNPDGPKQRKSTNFRNKTSEDRTIELVPFFDGSYQRKSNAGRPKEGLDSLPEDWYDQIIDMYSNGADDSEIMATIYMWRGRFSYDLWERWLKDEPEFSETIKMGRIIAKAWYIRLGREQLRNNFFPFVGWYMQMKNRFGWKDRNDVTSDDKQIGTEEDRKVIKFSDGTEVDL